MLFEENLEQRHNFLLIFPFIFKIKLKNELNNKDFKTNVYLFRKYSFIY